MTAGGEDRSDLARRIADHRWYHTIELAPGLTTPGWFDTRPAIDAARFPSRLDGRRALDVGTFDGFWAFEMERRGAAEVVAIDLLDPRKWDWPYGSDDAVVREMDTMKAAGAGFELAAAVLDSSVKRLELSVYDLDPAVVGQFDFAYVGSLLLHLRDPVLALERVRSVVRGEVLIVDAIDPELARVFPRRPVATLDGRGRPWWWRPNPAALARMVTAAGLVVVDGPHRFYMRPGTGQAVTRPALRALRSKEGRLAWITARHGDPHAALLTRAP
jgi:tRNA (mo5U34)-methyltransferase